MSVCTNCNRRQAAEGRKQCTACTLHRREIKKAQRARRIQELHAIDDSPQRLSETDAEYWQRSCAACTEAIRAGARLCAEHEARMN